MSGIALRLVRMKKLELLPAVDIAQACKSVTLLARELSEGVRQGRVG